MAQAWIGFQFPGEDWKEARRKAMKDEASKKKAAEGDGKGGSKGDGK